MIPFLAPPPSRPLCDPLCSKPEIQKRKEKRKKLQRNDPKIMSLQLIRSPALVFAGSISEDCARIGASLRL